MKTASTRYRRPWSAARNAIWC